MIDLSILDEDIVSSKPTDLEAIYYLFWEKGIDYNQFNELPIPYILSIIKTYKYIKDQEEKEIKKSKRR